MARAGTAAGAGRRPGRRPLAVLLGLILALVAAAPAAAAPQLVKIGDFDTPMYVTSPPGSSQLFVVEKGGAIKLVGGGTFLDLSAVTDGSYEERGLLSMAFSPNYASNGLFYVFYTDRDTGALKVVEYQRSANPAQANPTPRREFLEIPHGPEYHNGGQLQIGPDGMLYVSTGDGHDGNNAQDTSSRLGKILRIDPSTGAAAAGNPFGNLTWAYGMRNPWRFSFDRSTGDIAIGDVGSDGDAAREEINWGAAPGRAKGVNFGWPDAEGFGGTGGQRPIIAHDHTTFRAIVGGYVVRDQGLPTLRGRYIYGDFADQRIFSAVPRTGADDKPTGLTVTALTSFGQDACGHVYAASFNGEVYRLQDGAVSPCSLNGQTTDTAPPGVAVGLTGVRKLLKKRVLRIAVRCSEACEVAVGTRLRHVRRLATRHRALAANQRKVVRVKVSKALTRKLRKRVRRRGFVRIAVTVRATDAAGNVATKTKRGRLKRR